MPLHFYLTVTAWILVTYSLCVVGDAAEASRLGDQSFREELNR